MWRYSHSPIRTLSFSLQAQTPTTLSKVRVLANLLLGIHLTFQEWNPCSFTCFYLSRAGNAPVCKCIQWGSQLFLGGCGIQFGMGRLCPCSTEACSWVYHPAGFRQSIKNSLWADILHPSCVLSFPQWFATTGVNHTEEYSEISLCILLLPPFHPELPIALKLWSNHLLKLWHCTSGVAASARNFTWGCLYLVFILWKISFECLVDKGQPAELVQMSSFVFWCFWVTCGCEWRV